MADTDIDTVLASAGNINAGPATASSRYYSNRSTFSTRSVANLRPPQHVGEIGRGSELLEMHHVFGADITRRDNIAFISDDTIVYSIGAAVVFENITCAGRDYVLSIDEGGVGCVCVPPSK
jgi:hypothetical protein